MKRLAPMIAGSLLVLAPCQAMAAWVKIAEVDNKVYYLDPEQTVKLADNRFKAAARIVFQNNQKVKEKKAEEVYDCARRTITTGFVEVTLTSGKVVTQMMNDTEHPRPDTPGALKLKAVCDAPAPTTPPR